MAASSSGVWAPLDLRQKTKVDSSLPHNNIVVKWGKSKQRIFPLNGRGGCRIKCDCSDSLVPIRRSAGAVKTDEWRAGIQNTSASAFASSQPRLHRKQDKFYTRCTPKNSSPRSGDNPPKRDTGIANEKEWGIDMLNENVNETGINENGSTWYRENGEDIGENGYRCRWTRMGGQYHDGSSE